METESKKYSWKYVTASELLSHGACELIYAFAVLGDASAYYTLYDGENNLGEVIIPIEAGDDTYRNFDPSVPVYCRRGLYVEVDEGCVGIFVQWRELGHKEGG